METVFQYVGSDFGEGGAETLVRNYSLLLQQKGICVIVIALYKVNAQSINYKILNQNGVEVVSVADVFPCSVRPNFIKRIFNKVLFKYRISKALIYYINKYNPNAIHVHLNALWTLVPIMRKLVNIRLFYTCHSQPNIHLKKTKLYNELKAAYTLVHKSNLQMIALHSDMRDEINKLLDINNTIIVWNGIDFNKFNMDKYQKSAERERLGLSDNAYVVVHVGSFLPVKNHPFIVKVFNEVCKRQKNAFLLLVGSGDCTNTKLALNEQGLEGKYMILSHRTDVAEILIASDGFVFPSLYEGLPVAVVEAQISGLRCVVSECVTEDCLFYPSTIRLSLLTSPALWAEALLDKSYCSNYHKDISDFNIVNVVDKLQQLYFSKN